MSVQSPPYAPFPPAKPEPPPASNKQQESSYKETIESILVAFILAFIFRAFVVEAFVIPTGSMAPTLFGAHMRFRCADCGYRFDVNYSGRNIGDDVEIPSNAYVIENRNGIQVALPKVYNLHCPNCGYQVSTTDRDDPDNAATAPPVHYGDRILVLKYLYLFEEPHPWDVVVFKSPSEPNYTTNYIKRLVGLPGESLMVLDGDVYVGAAGEDVSQYHVKTKSRSAQEALWRVVNDNDYLPLGKETNRTWHQPWVQAAGSGWTLTRGSRPSRTLTFDNLSGTATFAFDPDANPSTHSLTEWLAYDVTMNQGEQNPADTSGPGYDPAPRNNVSDLKLSFFYQRRAGDGPLQAQLTKLDNTFTAQITRDRVSLRRKIGKLAGPDDLGEELASANPPEVKSSGPLHVEFMNVDYKVTLRLDGRDVLSSTAAQYHPDVKRLLDSYHNHTELPRPQVRIAAAQQRCELTHLSLWRDIYYTNRGNGLIAATPDNPVNLNRAGVASRFMATLSTPGGCPASTATIDFINPQGGTIESGQWAQFPDDDTRYFVRWVKDSSFAVKPALKRPVFAGATITFTSPPAEDEYFVLGDNSLISGDGRFWSNAVALPAEDLYVSAGRVPARFLLGKAFFVYWPAGYRAPLIEKDIIPNFGEMRFIH